MSGASQRPVVGERITIAFIMSVWDEEKFDHPTKKPIELVRKLFGTMRFPVKDPRSCRRFGNHSDGGLNKTAGI